MVVNKRKSFFFLRNTSLSPPVVMTGLFQCAANRHTEANEYVQTGPKNTSKSMLELDLVFIFVYSSSESL